MEVRPRGVDWETWLPPGCTTLPIRIGYCSTANGAHHFQRGDKNAGFMSAYKLTAIVHGRWDLVAN